MATVARAGAGERDDPAAPMAHGQILRALSGLYIGMFVAILSSTIVINALPTIVADLHTGQSTYTWVISSTLLATAVSSPIWGKLADLTSKKALVQLGLLVFVIGSVLSGVAPRMRIAARPPKAPWRVTPTPGMVASRSSRKGVWRASISLRSIT